MLVITTANLKGGSTKTTSAVFIAHVLADQGKRVLLVDSDPQGSALRWHEYAGGFPFPVVKLDTNRVHRDLPGIAGSRYDAVVIDTPPLEDHKGIVLSAIRAATHVLIPCAPTPIEYERLIAVRKVLEESADLRPDGEQPESAVLLTRTISGAASTRTYRELIKSDGWRVLSTHVGRLERYSQAYGAPITDARRGAYGDAVEELLTA